jgi:hypothetical protein
VTGPVSRRALLGASAAAAVALSGCDDVPLEQTRPGALTTPQATAVPDPGPDPDRDLLRAALLLEATQVARVERVLQLRLDPPARRRLAAAGAVHRAHVDLLRGDDAPPEVEPPSSVPRRLLGRLPGAEIAIAEQHAAAALAAESGPFARVLASMAAAARQQATALEDLA